MACHAMACHAMPCPGLPCHVLSCPGTVSLQMSVADYGPSSQTLTFLDPEDDLGSL